MTAGGAGKAIRILVAAVLVLIVLTVGTRTGAAELRLEQFGAVGDGRADDSAAFQEAIRSLELARGGAVVGRRGATYRISRSINLRRVSNIELRGNGATIFRFTPGTASNALTLEGAENILIQGWSFDSSYNAFEQGSTGSNPNVLLGVDDSRPNRNIVIRGNRFNNGNHANITIGTTGVDGKLPSGGFANENIRIEDNSLGNAGVGVFVYKATRGFHILRNVGANFSAAAVGVDTHAATDPDRRGYRIEKGEIRSNSFRNIVAATVPWNRSQAFAARGLVLKGAIHDVVVDGNEFIGIRSITNVDTYGLLVIKDQAPNSGTGSALTITDNRIEDVSAAAPGATAAWALHLGPGYSAVTISGNMFKEAERGVRLSTGSSWSFLSNRLESLALSTSVPLHIDASPVLGGPKRLDGNSFVRGRGQPVQAIQIVEAVPNLTVGRNDLVGYAAERR